VVKGGPLTLTADGWLDFSTKAANGYQKAQRPRGINPRGNNAQTKLPRSFLNDEITEHLGPVRSPPPNLKITLNSIVVNLREGLLLKLPNARTIVQKNRFLSHH